MLADIGNWQSLCTYLDVPEAVLSNLVHKNLENNAKKREVFSCIATLIRENLAGRKLLNLLLVILFIRRNLLHRLLRSTVLIDYSGDKYII